MSDDSGTWHHGLVARWWAELSEPEPGEIAYVLAAIERFGEPVLDAGCGSGRILLPLLEAGLDADGTDVSADMIEHARAAAAAAGFAPDLSVRPLREVAARRMYRTILLWGVLGIGGRRDHDLEALRRLRDHLEPGGALLIAHELPYAVGEDERWARWLPGRRSTVPGPWPDAGDRRTLPDGDELELITRLGAFHPLEQLRVFEMRARLWRDGNVVREEERALAECLYFAREVRLMLDVAGFSSVSVESCWSGASATDDDGNVVFVARA